MNRPTSMLLGKLLEHVAFYLALTLLIMIIFFPLGYMVLSSLTSEADLVLLGASLKLPTQLTLTPYEDAFALNPIAKALVDTAIYSTISAFTVIVISSFAAFPFAFANFRYRQLLLKTLIFIQTVPGFIFMVPIFFYFRTLQLTDTYFALVFVIGGFTLPFAIWLFYGFFRTLPAELIDSARVDGCSDYRILITIVLPLVAPGVIAIFIFSFLLAWGDFLWPLILTFSNVRAVSMVVVSAVGAWKLEYARIMAIGVMSIIPPVILALIFQRWLIQGIVAGAVKG